MRSALFALLIAFVLLAAGCASQPQQPPAKNATANGTGTQPPGNGTRIANPASLFCVQKGYKLEIRKGADGGEIGYCIFQGGRECEEWKFFRGECSENQGMIAKEGGFCGGIAGIPCAAGLECRLDGAYPDAGGKCAKAGSAPQFVQCQAIRDDACTTEYLPVCGRAGDTPSTYDFEDYPSACVACSKSSPATGYYAGTCEQNNQSHKAKKSGEIYYCPEKRSEGCTGESDPVCGRLVDPSSSASFFRDFSSPCEACSASSNAVAYYVGTCFSRGFGGSKP